MLVHAFTDGAAPGPSTMAPAFLEQVSTNGGNASRTGDVRVGFGHVIVDQQTFANHVTKSDG